MTALPTAKIVAFLAKHDSGEYGNANCPHCGATGRYVWGFLCDDGKIRGAMAGCVKLFRKDNGGVARLTAKALEAQETAHTRNGGRLASWWRQILDAVDDLAAEGISRDTFVGRVLEAESARQEWLQRRGYGRRRVAR